MPKFEYTSNFTRAAVSFPAHKFPHTSSVYYQCNVRLCINSNGGCNPAECNPGNQAAAAAVTSSSAVSSSSTPRRKRMAAHEGDQLAGEEAPQSSERLLRANGPNVSFDVYSGLYVSDLDTGGKLAFSSVPIIIQQILKQTQYTDNYLSHRQ